MSKPRAVLIQEAIPRVFDTTALSNMRLIDVARALDSATAKSSPDQAVVRQLLTRILAAVSVSALGVLGRSEQTRLIRHLNRSLDRIVGAFGVDESALDRGDIKARVGAVLRCL